MSNYKQFLIYYYCIIKDKTLIPLKHLLKSLFTIIKTIESNDINLYNKVISSVFTRNIEKLDVSQYKLDIINEIRLNIHLISNINDNSIRDIIKSIIISIDKYNRILLNKRDSFMGTDVINNEFLNSEFLQLGNIDGPTFAKKFTGLTYYPKISASPTVVIYGNINPISISNSIKRQNSSIISKRYYMKLFRTDSYNEELLKELNIYEILFNLTKYNITPHILNRICTGKILNILEFFDYVQGKDSIGKIMATKGRTFGSFTNNEAYMIMTEQGNKVVRDYIRDKLLELDSVIFQILYTLYVFSKIRFYHYDLHSGNSFIYELDKPIDLYYKVMGKYYHLKTKYFIKIYDFDNSIITQKCELIIDSETKITFNKMVDIRDTSSDAKILNKKDIDLMLISWSDLNKNEKLTLFKREYRQVLTNIVKKEDEMKLMENIWKSCTFFKEFEIAPIDEKQNLVYTIDDYRINYY